MRLRLPLLLALAAVLGGAAASTPAFATRPVPITLEARPDRLPPPPSASPAKSPAEARVLGADWLVRSQAADGGWGSGSWGQAAAQMPGDVATTVVATLALLRDGGVSGRHATPIRRGVDYVLAVVERSPADGPRLDTAQGTQPQHKLGGYVDTHLAAMLLSEVSGKLDPARNERIRKALPRVVDKVTAAEDGAGRFESGGWAPVISSSFAAQGLMQAQAAGVAVDQKVLDRADAYQKANVAPSGAANASDGAGVELYALAGAMKSARTSADVRGKKDMDDVNEATVQRLAANTEAMISGFGSVGGEEMLSYMMISDSLAAEGGDAWKSWEARIGAYLLQIQNADGSWVGHHCITSPVFVTAAAVLTLGAGHVQGSAVPVQPGQVKLEPVPTPSALVSVPTE